MVARFPALLLGMSLLLACKDSGSKSKPDEAEPAPTGSAPAKPAEEPTTAQADAHPLLDWLDPDAVAVVYMKRGAEIDPRAFSAAFAVPPKLARMLRDVPGVVEGLDAIRDPSDPHPDTWFGPEALAATSVVSSGTYVLHTLAKPRAEVAGFLEHASMRSTEIEGFTLYEPQGPFPWKVAFLTDTVVAFVPVKEIGSGLSPLTAGRDLPASQAEEELRTVLERDPTTVLEAIAAGPLLHLDLGQDLQQYAVRARPAPSSGLQVEVILAPMDDPQQAATSLRERDLSLETDALAAVAKKVVFSVEGPTVVGRLQASAADARTLGED